MNASQPAETAIPPERGDMILCGVDESDEARLAARVAAGIARRLRRPLMLAHIASEPYVAPRPAATLVERTHETEDFERAGHETTVLDPILPAIDVSNVTAVEFGRPPEKLRELARDHAAALIVVGTGSLGGLGEFVVGSTALALTRDAPCPVVVVPPDAAPGPASAIVCGIEASATAADVAAAADALARVLGLRLVLVHVAKPSEFEQGEAALASVRAIAPEAELELVSAESTEKALSENAAQHDAEMFVVGAHDHGLAHSTLFGSVFRALLKIAGRPVVVVPPERGRP